jgi:protocatechuate 3,4-dioxygenase beta subunit
MRSMSVGKLKLAASVLILTMAAAGVGVSVWARNEGLDHQGTGAKQTGKPAATGHIKKEPPSPEPAKTNDTDAELLVSGRVIDAGGSAVMKAQVGILLAGKTMTRGGDFSEKLDVVGPVATDASGQFRLTARTFIWNSFASVQLIATAAGQGLECKDLRPEQKLSDLIVKLPPEQLVRGRFVDLQGQPAVDLPVQLVFVGGLTLASWDGVSIWQRHDRLPLWPAPVLTDRQGRFTFRGIGANSAFGFQVFDDRFARQRYALKNQAGEGKEIPLTLAPAHIIEGQVTCEDTGKPVAHARLAVAASQGRFGSRLNMGGQADEQGRFRINPFPGDYFGITVYPPEGEPYLIRREEFAWPKGKVKHQLNITVPRGVLVRGKVIEAPSGKPVAGASVQFLARIKDNPNLRDDIVTGWEGRLVSGADGSFQIAVVPGPGHLAFHSLISGFAVPLQATASDFIQIEVHSSKIYYEKPGGLCLYAHSWAPLATKTGDTQEVNVKLRRGVSVKGQLVDNAGKPVAEALMVSRLASILPWNFEVWRPLSRPVSQGQFELHGLGPKETCTVLFLDPKNKQGTVAQISGKDAGGEPVTIRLAPCGAAVVRFVDSTGKPLAGHELVLEMVVQPGASKFNRKALEQGLVFADSDFVANLDRLNYWSGPRSDAQGRVTLPALIPGATYRLVPRTSRGSVGQDFRVDAGQTINLPDVKVTEMR